MRRRRTAGCMASASVSAGVNQAAAVVSVTVGPRLLARPDDASVQADGHLLAGAFDRVDDDVRGVGVDPGHAGERDRDPGLLEDLPPRPRRTSSRPPRRGRRAAPSSRRRRAARAGPGRCRRGRPRRRPPRGPGPGVGADRGSTHRSGPRAGIVAASDGGYNPRQMNFHDRPVNGHDATVSWRAVPPGPAPSTLRTRCRSDAGHARPAKPFSAAASGARSGAGRPARARVRWGR